jgi:translation initiation factor IF-2
MEDNFKAIEVLNEKIQKRADDRAAKDNEDDEEKPKVNPTLNLILKADVHGSLDAIQGVISGLPSHEVEATVVASGVGQLGEADVDLAIATGSQIITFNTPVDRLVQRYAKKKDIAIDSHTIIYNLIDSVKDKLSELLPPVYEISVEGEAQVLQIYTITLKKGKKDTIAGCKITNGKIARSSAIRIIRGGNELHRGI